MEVVAYWTHPEPQIWRISGFQSPPEPRVCNPRFLSSVIACLRCLFSTNIIPIGVENAHTSQNQLKQNWWSRESPDLKLYTWVRFWRRARIWTEFTQKWHCFWKSLKCDFSELRRSWTKSLGTTNTYCSWNVHFRDLFVSADLRSITYPLWNIEYLKYQKSIGILSNHWYPRICYSEGVSDAPEVRRDKKYLGNGRFANSRYSQCPSFLFDSFWARRNRFSKLEQKSVDFL